MNSPEHIFIRVIETGSLKLAAAQLRIEASTVSRKVAKLEQRLNAKLLNRSTVKTTPTELGLAYYNGLKNLYDQQSALEEEVFNTSTQVKGVLRIATTVDLGDKFITPIIHTMMCQAPELKVELIYGSELTNLTEQNIDVAIRFGKPVDSHLYAIDLGSIPRILVASPEYLKQHGTPHHIDDLAQHRFILYASAQANFDIQFQSGERFAHNMLSSSLSVNSLRSIAYMVKAGHGIHWGPSWLYQKELEEGSVVNVLAKHPVIGLPLHALYTNRDFQPYRVRWFLTLLREHLHLDQLNIL
ncbi:LysR family transcriptional regulator [Pseudoalteromonas sp. JBTF-M23]|uniref:LysR family transcriptional regulator n=1 Tax=Pseudoalteromonas caenipelagi TaxID=2726988 RepID=A0A849VEK5_9GAMM|nr:LysR family transcriptional regulator [Pseudoalteromonas caenipelagi]NOU52149.1 LysR family transcriptional regulator [Pseudoalteromonas caenipelagi]